MSPAEELFAAHCRVAGLPPPEREHRFHPERRWRFDFSWSDHRLAVEIEGGLFVAGRHSRGLGFEADAIKYAEAILAGWRVLRFSPRQVKDGTALAYVQRALECSG